jgi:hypothetical protein
MAENQAIAPEKIELDGDVALWNFLRAALRAKEAQPDASLLPMIRILKSNEIVATIYESSSEPRTLLLRDRMGVRKIPLNWCDSLSMLYRTALLTLQKMDGTAVVFLGERAVNETGRAMICAVKWTARQFLQRPPRGAIFPETQDAISQPFYLEDAKICWQSETTSALQFS